ncbi:MAG: OmpA family protein [Armatimonadota bacterium]|nr:OmpA family protein [bacterium]
MRKRRDDGGHGNSERWLLTYSDMITLLMAFFIMMYSMSVLNLSKFREAAISIRSGFGGMIKGQGKSPLGTAGQFGPKPSAIEGDTAGVSWRVLKPLVNYIESGDGENTVEIGEDNRGIVITIGSDSMLFDPASAVVRAKAYPMLDKIATMLAKVDNLVLIEGHTCSLPTNSSRYPSNWELSTARATNVLRYLVEKKQLQANRFAASGYGAVRPMALNDTNEHRKKNRRVEIVILRPEALLGKKPKESPVKISDPTESVFQRSVDF